MVKADFWVSEQIVSCSRDARLLFIGLWCFCDDAGVHPASYKRLKMEVFPGDNFSEDDIKLLVGELMQWGLVREYAIENNIYWIVTGWKKHQKIDKPTYRFPLPQSELLKVSNESKQLRLDDNSTSTRRLVAGFSEKSSQVVATKEKKGKEKENKKDIREVEASPIDVPESNSLASTQELFTYWQIVMNHPQAKFVGKRQRAVAQALKWGYSLEDLKKAIDGCFKTPFNMGKNENRQVYDDISLIFRDADHIERFMNNATSSNTIHEPNSTDDLMAGVI